MGIDRFASPLSLCRFIDPEVNHPDSIGSPMVCIISWLFRADSRAKRYGSEELIRENTKYRIDPMKTAGTASAPRITVGMNQIAFLRNQPREEGGCVVSPFILLPNVKLSHPERAV